MGLTAVRGNTPGTERQLPLPDCLLTLVPSPCLPTGAVVPSLLLNSDLEDHAETMSTH